MSMNFDSTTFKQQFMSISDRQSKARFTQTYSHCHCRRFFNCRYPLMIIWAIMVLTMITPQIHVKCLESSQPFISSDYSNALIRTGYQQLNSGIVTPTSNADFTHYSIRVVKPVDMDGEIFIGMVGLDLEGFASGRYCHLRVRDQTATDFEINLYFTIGMTFLNVETQYIIIDGDYSAYYQRFAFGENINPNVVLTPTNSYQRNYTATSFQSDKTYKTINLLQYFNINPVNMTENQMEVQYLFQKDVSNLSLSTLVIEGDHETRMVWLLTKLINFEIDHYETTTRIEFHQLEVSGTGGIDRELVEVMTETNLTVLETNWILGIKGYHFIDKLQFSFYLFNNVSSGDNEIWFSKTSYTKSLKADLLIIYTVECSQTLVFYSEVDGTCKPCLQNCFKCTNLTECIECKTNYTLISGNTECVCNEQIVAGVCYDFENSSTLGGCASPIEDPEGSGMIICLACSSEGHFLPNGNMSCVCKDGYETVGNDLGVCVESCSEEKKMIRFINSTSGDTSCVCIEGYEMLQGNTQSCSEICGDGLVFEDECDDGNTEDNDGCSADCIFEEGFVCTNFLCKSEINLHMEIDSIKKNENNSAVYRIKATNDDLPFELEWGNFVVNEGGSTDQMLQLTVYTENRTNSYILQTTILMVQQDMVQFYVEYEFTIQGLQSQIWLNTSLTKYLKDQILIEFQSQGDNMALQYSDFITYYEWITLSMQVMSILSLVLFVVGLGSSKYIGLQNLLVLGLIYLSQFLIVDLENFPAGFVYLGYFRYCLGMFNADGQMGEYLSLSIYEPMTVSSQKFENLGYKKQIVENYNVSFILLGLVFGGFLLTMVIRRNRQEELQIKKNQPSKKNLQEKIRTVRKNTIKSHFPEEVQSLNFWSDINERCFYIVSQVSLWCLLQVLAAISAQTNIRNSELIFVQEKRIFSKFNGIVIQLSLIIILSIGLTQFWNMYLGMRTLGRLNERPQELLYKKITFIYLLIMGVLIMFWYHIKQQYFYCSTMVIAVHLIYMIVLLRLKPYRLSLHIHSFGLFINQIFLLMVLVFINMLNYLGNFNETLVLGLGFFIVGICVLTIILGVIRLYYEYRYGKQLEEEILRQRKFQQQLQKQKEQYNFKVLKKKLELEAAHRLNPVEAIRRNNEFLYENQMRQQQMEDYWEFLQNNKQHWSKEKIEEEYFRKFERKPLKWLKRNERKQYDKIMQERKQKRILAHEAKMQREVDPELIRVKQRLRKDFKKAHKKLPKWKGPQ